ncbi:homoserine dehydrogenase [Candidatus Bathyarchaeota archaeon]|nr:homoserine dehydrogenase [Candidatus Bathyarchaeota archaeon]
MKAILVGFGFIGRSLVKTIRLKKNTLNLIDKEFKLVGVSDLDGYLYNEKGLSLEKLASINEIPEYSPNFLMEKSSLELIEKCDADIMIETTPTNIEDGKPGLTHMEKALSKGMHVVTSNKGPLVVEFKKLVNLSKEMGVEFKYEATVAGALPIFSLVNECLQGDEILRISGILNGTANYILSKMYFEGTSFELTLKEAQERGITESDPTYDIEGIDAACKVVILANAIMKRDVRFKDVKRVGIKRITPEAVNLAKQSGYVIKLIGTIDKNLEVAPKLIPETHPLCVHGTLNVLHLETDLAKVITIIGYGAGRETVSAMVNDIISVIKKRN